jgi:autotransporter-associated beta strand protein
LIVVIGAIAAAESARAGGGGENMLLVVNPNDPASLQVANAYAALRDIPANNVVYIAPPSDYHNDGQPISQAEINNYYLTPIVNAISSRGITNQIDYIGTIGEATCYSISAQFSTPSTTANSLNYALSLLTPLTNGSGLTLQGATFLNPSGPTSGLYQDSGNLPVGGNAAIHHSASYMVNYPVAGVNAATNYYMSGTIGYTGTNGNTVAQVIASLASAAAADGTHPGGAVYYENSSDVRATLRNGEWSSTASQLAARSVSGQFENNTPGATPLDRSNVAGAICGAATLTLSNGSIYMPGSWADDVTSYGCYFQDTTQTKATQFIASGAAGTTGAVAEPYAIAARFTNTSIQTFIADGSTLGEAFAKSVASPDAQMPLGDMLAQPNADVPVVSYTSGPGNYGAAHGVVSLSTSAVLVNPRIAVGTSEFDLVVDGKFRSKVGAMQGCGAFTLDTSGLSDGVHEVRAVAINNTAAESEGYAAMPIVVDNHGRSISFTGGKTTLGSSPVTIGLATLSGDGAIAQIELTCLGRVVAQSAGSPGTLSVSPSALAPGDNVITPVAVFSDGIQVAGGSFTMHVETGWANAWTNAAGTSLWSNPSNWSGGTANCGDGVARFSGAAAGTIWLDAPANMQEIDFNNNGGGNYTIAAVGGQTLTLSSTNGPMSESLINVSSGLHTISAALTLAAAGNLVAVNGPADSLTISGGVSGPGGLTKTGSGTLTLTGGDSFTGAMALMGGKLQVGNGASATSVPNTSGVLDDGSLIFNQANNVVFAAPISGNGTLTKTGTGTLILSGTNTYSGGTILNSGKLIITSAAALPDDGDLTIGSATSLFQAAQKLIISSPRELPGGADLTIGSESSFFQTSGAVPASTGESVPEPCTLGLVGVVAVGVMALFAKRHRRSSAS